MFSIEKISKIIKIIGLPGALVIGWQVGSWLYASHDEAMAKFQESMLVGKANETRFLDIMDEVRKMREDLADVRERQARIEGKLDIKLRALKGE